MGSFASILRVLSANISFHFRAEHSNRYQCNHTEKTELVQSLATCLANLVFPLHGHKVRLDLASWAIRFIHWLASCQGKRSGNVVYTFYETFMYPCVFFPSCQFDRDRLKAVQWRWQRQRKLRIQLVYPLRERHPPLRSTYSRLSAVENPEDLPICSWSFSFDDEAGANLMKTTII